MFAERFCLRRGKLLAPEFVSPVVSPGGVKMCKLLITGDDGNNWSRYSDTEVCALLTTSANSCKKGVLALGNPCSIR
jgi:hypothetical protein